MRSLVIGGTSGLGLAIALELMKESDVTVVGRHDPKIGCEFVKTDLKHFDTYLFKKLSEQNFDNLVISSGIGHVSMFENYHISDIEEMITVNTISVIKILKIFYEQIKKGMNVAVMSSIAGTLVSPAFSVYSASKAALTKFLEAINIELQTNKILCVSPGKLEGTSFFGGEQNLELLKVLAQDILERMKNKETLFIPQYGEIYKGVIERYNKDPVKFGISSLEYKQDRIQNKPLKICYIDCDYDSLDEEKIKTIKDAKSKCDYLIAKAKNKELIKSIKYIDEIVDNFL